MASCTGLAYSDQHGCTIPGTFLACALWLCPHFGSGVHAPGYGHEAVWTQPPEAGRRKEKKGLSNTGTMYDTLLVFRVREQSLPKISFSHSRHP